MVEKRGPDQRSAAVAAAHPGARQPRGRDRGDERRDGDDREVLRAAEAGGPGAEGLEGRAGQDGRGAHEHEQGGAVAEHPAPIGWCDL
jgi:hypothetical protein